MAKYYGCRLIAPKALAGTHVLDLGCGAGRDCYALSAMVGEYGSVTGVDMTEEQLAVAKKYQDFHREQFNYKQANTHFLQGYLEQLDELVLDKNFFDVIVSSCVLNLCMDKSVVLKHAYSLLKPGGEMFFSNVYADCRIPAELAKDPVLYGECLSGALYWNDFISLAKQVGFADQRLVEDRPLTIENSESSKKLAILNFIRQLIVCLN